MKHIYAVGCSFTKFPNVKETELWPAVLAEKTNCSVINDGMPGGSNNRSFRKLVEFLTTTNIPKDDITFLVQITSPIRFEFQEYENGSWARVVMNVKGKQAHTPVISNSTGISKSKIIRAGRKKLNAKMLNYYDEEEWYDYIRQLSQISHLLETYNVNYRLLSFIIPKLTEERLYFLNNNFKWISGNIQESNIHEMYTYDPDTAKENQHHPTLENHIEIANYILSKLSNSD